MTYIMLEKSLTLLYVKEKISKSRGLEKNSFPNQIIHTPSPTKVK